MLTLDGSGPVEERPDARLVTDQDDVHVGVAGGPFDGPPHHLLGRVVAAHGIDRHAGSRQGSLAALTLQ